MTCPKKLGQSKHDGLHSQLSPYSNVQWSKRVYNRAKTGSKDMAPKTTRPGKTVGYVRVSTDGQEEGQGLEVQRQNIVAYAAVQGLSVDTWYQDVESGAKSERPGLGELREAVAAGEVATVLVYRLDRLSRETLLSETLYRELAAKSKVVSVSETLADGFTGDLMRRILAAFADYERAVIATRTKTGRRESVRKNGTYAGGPGVYGYSAVGRRGEPGKGELLVNEGQAEAIRLAFALRSEGLTLLQIAEALNERGHTTAKGAAFGHVQVKRILDRKTFYQGSGVLTRTIQAETAAHSAILAS